MDKHFSALAVLSGQARSPAQQQTHEMTVPNELIGCIIGKGGSKVAEIRSVLSLNSLGNVWTVWNYKVLPHSP